MTKKSDVSKIRVGVANAVHSVKNGVVAAEPAVKTGSTQAVSVIGSTVSFVGEYSGKAINLLDQWVTQSGDSATSTGGKVGFRLLGGVTWASGWVAEGMRVSGEKLREVAPVIGAGVAGVTTGSASAVSGAVDAVALTEADVNSLQERLHKSARIVRERAERRREQLSLAQQENRRQELLDMLVVAGVSLAAMLRDPSLVSAEIEQAFAAAYPGLAANGESFLDVVDSLDSSQLLGFTSAVKGKLFEMQFVDYLNDGNLPDGQTAELAESPTQAGFDIKIIDESGATVEALQAKATDSVAYVQEALQRYPEIDVVTTSEVYSELVALGVTDRVVDGGISDAALEQQVQSAVDSSGAIDWLPTSVGMAVIALSTFVDSSMSWEQRGREFGVRGAKAGLSTWVASGAMVATQTWWLGLISGVGAHFLSSRGANRREHYEALRRVVENLERRVGGSGAVATSQARGRPLATR
jgi:hypothetical protein